ncbi:MAG: transposase [Planctomycetota bacterium]
MRPTSNWLMIDAWCRCKPHTVLADAGYDSAKNHALARDRMGIKSWIKTGIGRPTNKPPTDRHQRYMQRKRSGSQAGKPYVQRAQVETTISMIKRNLGGYLRARTAFGREMEMMFKVVVHNLMVV